MAGLKPKSYLGIAVVVAAIIALGGGLLWFCGCFGGGRIGTARAATIIAVNDIYRIEGVGEKELGGLHRLRTLRKTLEQENRNILLLHAGDFLSPSLAGRIFKGEQIVDAMNNLDGDPKKFDKRMFVTFGNHEFDDSDCNVSPAPLMARLDESQFTWLNANLDFSSCASMKDVMAHKNVKRTVIAELDGIKFGIFGIGLTPDIKDAKKYPRFGSPYDSARAAIKELRSAKADVVVALTHLDASDDEVLLRSLSDDGLDFLIGGHDHTATTIKDAHEIERGFKSDSDGRSARQLDVSIPPKGRPQITTNKLVMLDDQGAARDPAISELAKKWAARAQAKICADRKKAGAAPFDNRCLDSFAGKAQFEIRLEEEDNRGTETDFGKWLADTVRRRSGADVAIVNAGSLGLNTNLPAGATLSVRDVVDIFRFDDVVAVRSFPASTVCAAVRQGFDKAGTGAWPHVAGMLPQDEKATGISAKWNGRIEIPSKKIFCGPPEEEQPKENIAVAGVPFVLCGGDNSPLLANEDDKTLPARSDKVAKCQSDLRKQPQWNNPVSISRVAEEEIVKAGPEGVKLPSRD
jgi:2',3'-cyclic-nucleotide 2'-phosphodiesterase (5'-nucleotidase family)